MLRIAHLNAANQITGKLDQMGYRILPVVNTPLSCLNADITVVPNVDGNDFIPRLDNYVAAAWENTPGQDHSAHVANVEATANSIARFVQSHLSFAKNVVKPIITEFVEEFTERTNSLYISPTDNLRIHKLNLPTPMLVTDLKDLIDDYAHVAYTGVDIPNFNMPDLSIVEITELMKTGSKALDGAIDEWVALVGEAEIVQYYERAFGTVKSSYPRTHLISNQDNCWNSTLAVFLMASKLHNNPPKGVAMSLVDYNVSMASVRDAAGAILASIYKMFESYVKTQTLIRTAHANQVCVIAPVYEDWIASGGSDALIYSVLITSKRINFVSEIDAARVDLLKAWELHCAMTLNTERTRKFIAGRKAFYDTMFYVVERNADPIFSHLKAEGASVDHVQMQEYAAFKQKFNDFVEQLRESDFADIWKLAKHVVCNMLFYYTDAGQILDGIEDACKTNPDMDVNEAALLSTITYVTKYVCNQMTITKI